MSLLSLAPLAGFSDLAFRSLCFSYSCDYAVTEMISAQALYYENEKTETLLTIGKDEGKLGVQLFGRDPKMMEKVIQKKINPLAFDVIDLNMGCPAPKIVKNKEGSYLMKEPLLVGQMISSMVRASNKPISAKFRLGMDEDHENFLEIGKICQEEGASFVTIHGRYSKQMYAGRADWEKMAQLKDHLSIPVIVNGDVTSPEDAKKLLDLTEADGLAIGRGALGRPYLFVQIKQYLKTNQYKEFSWPEIFAIIRKQYLLALEHKGEKIALLDMRKHFASYLRHYPGGARIRDQVNRLESFAEIEKLLALQWESLM